MITALHVDALALERGERLLFKNLGFSLRSGRAAALIGRNGAGKTSLLRAVAGLTRPLAGAVRFEGADGPLEADDARRRGLHMIGHLDALKAGRTAREELAFQSAWTGGRPAQAAAAAEAFDIVRLLDLEVRRLSAGQRRRLALARLLAAPRSLWLLDEPMAPLDAEHRAGFGRIMQAHLDGGGMILAAVHDPLPVEAATVEVGA
jgi:heme exporter protein A